MPKKSKFTIQADDADDDEVTETKNNGAITEDLWSEVHAEVMEAVSKPGMNVRFEFQMKMTEKSMQAGTKKLLECLRAYSFSGGIKKSCWDKFEARRDSHQEEVKGYQREYRQSHKEEKKEYDKEHKEEREEKKAIS